MLPNSNCKYFEGCSAPLCPMTSVEQNRNYCWYPDEEICRKRKGLPVWLKQQRKIAKKAKLENYYFYFLLEMLEVPFRVTSSVKGLNPDQPLENEGKQLKAWHNRYKGSKPRKLTAEHREKLKNAAQKARWAKQQKRRLVIDETTNITTVKEAYYYDELS